MDARLIEVIVILGLSFVSIIMLRNSQLKNLFELAVRGGGLLIASILFMLTFQLTLPLLGNWIISALLSALTSAIFGWQLVRWIRQREKDRQWIAIGEKWLRWPKALNRFLNVAFVSGLWCIAGIVAALVGELILINPAGEHWLARSWVWRHLVDPQTLQADSTDSRDVHNSLAISDVDHRAAVQRAAIEQADFFQRFASGVRQTKQQVLAATGLDELQREIQRTRQVLNLSDDEKFWLLENHPPLSALVDHPVILKLLKNDELLARFERLADGHAEEVLMIGADPDIQLLLNEPSIKQLIREIDLAQLLRQCKLYQRPSIQK